MAVDYNVQTTTSTGLTSQQREFFDKQLLENAKPKLVHNQFGQKRNIPKNSGQTINFRRFSPLPAATTPLTEGVTPNGRSLEITDVVATVKQYGDYIMTSDILDLTGPEMVKKTTELNKLLGDQAGRTLDSVTAAVLAGGTNVQFANGATGKADVGKDDVLTVDEIKRAVATLRKMNAPTIDGSYVAIIHPTVAYDIMSDEEWIGVKNYDSGDLYKGELGMLYGVRFFDSSEAFVETGAGASGADVYHTIVLGADAYGVTEVEGGGLKMITQAPVDPLHQRSTQGWKAIHTAEILTEEFMVNIYSGATLA